VRAAVQGKDAVPAAALPAATAVSQRRDVPAARMPASVPFERRSCRRAAAVSSNLPLLPCPPRRPEGRRGRGDSLPASVSCAEREGGLELRRTPLRAMPRLGECKRTDAHLPPTLPATVQRWPLVSNDRVSARPADLAAAMPHVRRPVLPVPRARGWRLAIATYGRREIA
jgi:hypothetical protein